MRLPRSVVTRHEVRLALHDLGGEETAPLLLLCHATGLCGLAYAPLARELRRDFRALAIDFRGHGDSSSPEKTGFDWRHSAEDLLDVVEALGPPDELFAFGHSFGGGVILLAEAARPGTFGATYLYEPIVLPPTAGAAAAGSPLPAAARRRRAVFSSKAEALWRYASRPPLDSWRADCLFSYVEHGFFEREGEGVALKCSPEDEAATFEAPGKPTTALLRELQVPSTVAAGAEEGPGPASWAAAIAQGLPAGRLERYAGLGHFGPLEAPGLVAEAVRRALLEPQPAGEPRRR